MCLWRELPFFNPHWPHVRRCGFGGHSLLAYCCRRLFAGQSSHLIIEGVNHCGHPFYPSARSARGHIHLHGILVPKQAFCQGAVEPLNYSLVPVNIGAPAANGCFVLAHSLVHATHELAPQVNLQHLWPFKRPMSVDLRKAPGNFIAVFIVSASAASKRLATSTIVRAYL